MRQKNGCDRYVTKTLIHQVYFPEGEEVCRFCPFCVADPSNHKREICQITREILPFAELVIDSRCPLISDNELLAASYQGDGTKKLEQAGCKTVPRCPLIEE